MRVTRVGPPRFTWEYPAGLTSLKTTWVGGVEIIFPKLNRLTRFARRRGPKALDGIYVTSL
jgi:hypothetical protein